MATRSRNGSRSLIPSCGQRSCQARSTMPYDRWRRKGWWKYERRNSMANLWCAEECEMQLAHCVDAPVDAGGTLLCYLWSRDNTGIIALYNKKKQEEDVV